MKKYQLLLLAISATGLVACGGGGGNQSPSSSSSGGVTSGSNGSVDNSSTIAPDVQAWGRNNAFDEASALVHADLINAEQRVSR